MDLELGFLPLTLRWALHERDTIGGPEDWRNHEWTNGREGESDPFAVF